MKKLAKVLFTLLTLIGGFSGMAFKGDPMFVAWFFLIPVGVGGLMFINNKED